MVDVNHKTDITIQRISTLSMLKELIPHRNMFSKVSYNCHLHIYPKCDIAFQEAMTAMELQLPIFIYNKKVNIQAISCSYISKPHQ